MASPATTITLEAPIDVRIFEQFNKRCPFVLNKYSLFLLCHVGSHSHGTYIPPTDPMAVDDVDYMGIVVPPIDYVLGTEQWEGIDFKHEELDCVFFSLEKFVRLMLKSNPNVLGMLWMREQDYIWRHPVSWMLLDTRDAFSSLQAYPAFMGYAYGQLKRMTSFDKPTTDLWDHSLAIIDAAGWTVDQVTDKSASLKMPNYYQVLMQVYPELRGVIKDGEPLDTNRLDKTLNDAKVAIQKIHARHFQGYMGAKRKALVRQFGYDVKNAAHLVRLLLMCVEFLTDGRLRVYRHDAAMLMDIKQGRWSLQKVQAFADQLFAAAEEAKSKSPLPEQPDRARVNRMLIEVQKVLYF